jgi:hypothetical protein
MKGLGAGGIKFAPGFIGLAELLCVLLLGFPSNAKPCGEETSQGQKIEVVQYRSVDLVCIVIE